MSEEIRSNIQSIFRAEFLAHKMTSKGVRIPGYNWFDFDLETPISKNPPFTIKATF